PVILIRPLSTSAATGLVLDIFKESGADSYAGYAASIIMSCTESIFYTMSVYFMIVKITKTRYTLPGALLSTLAGVIASLIIASMM
ncbi:MAG: spore maturation protein, partial [Lachnospiraceae bacterium]